MAGKTKSSFHGLLSARMDESEAKGRFASSSPEERQTVVADAVPKQTKVAIDGVLYSCFRGILLFHRHVQGL